MYVLELVFRTIVELVKQVCLLPRTIVDALQQRRRTALNEQEAERLDRIRNPSKYQGK